MLLLIVWWALFWGPAAERTWRRQGLSDQSSLALSEGICWLRLPATNWTLTQASGLTHVTRPSGLLQWTSFYRKPRRSWVPNYTRGQGPICATVSSKAETCLPFLSAEWVFPFGSAEGGAGTGLTKYLFPTCKLRVYSLGGPAARRARLSRAQADGPKQVSQRTVATSRLNHTDWLDTQLTSLWQPAP